MQACIIAAHSQDSCEEVADGLLEENAWHHAHFTPSF